MALNDNLIPTLKFLKRKRFYCLNLTSKFRSGTLPKSWMTSIVAYMKLFAISTFIPDDPQVLSFIERMRQSITESIPLSILIISIRCSSIKFIFLTKSSFLFSVSERPDSWFVSIVVCFMSIVRGFFRCYVWISCTVSWKKTTNLKVIPSTKNFINVLIKLKCSRNNMKESDSSSINNRYAVPFFN